MDVPTTKAYDWDVENTELLDEIDVVDGELHTTDTFDQVVPLIEDDALREEEETGYNMDAVINGAGGTIQWNFYNKNVARKDGGRELLTRPLLDTEDIKDQQFDIRADTMLVNALNAIFLGEIANTRKQVAYLKATNRWQQENLTGADDIYTGVAVHPMHPQESVEEIERYAGQDDVKYVFALPPKHEPLGNKRYHPILEAAERHDLPIVMHGMSVSMKGFPGGNLRMDNFFEHRSLSQFLGHMRNAVSLIGQEIPERFDVDFMFLEHTLSWVPLLMGRLDRMQEVRGYDIDGLLGKPSEYLQEFYYGTQPLESYQDPSYLGMMLEKTGLNDQIVYTSDYPHRDADHVGMIADHEGLSREQKVKILQDNAKDVFDI